MSKNTQTQATMPALGSMSKIMLVSFAAAFVLVRKAPYLTVSNSFIRTFFTLYAVQLFAWAFYKVILYPKLLSPIRHLPGPTGNNFFMGQWFRILREPTGEPMKDFVRDVPNDGVIRYLGFFNVERVLITSPKTLSEVLVTHSYDFVKPGPVIRAMKRVLGEEAVLLTEGDVHRTQRKHLMPAFAFRHIKELYPKFWAKAVEMTEVLARDVKASPEDVAATATREAATQTFFKDELASGTVKLDDSNHAKSPWSVMNIAGYASRATLDIIGIAGMGFDFGSLQDPNNELAESYHRLMSPGRYDIFIGILITIMPYWLFRMLPLKREQDVEQAGGVVRKTAIDLIARKRAISEKKAAAGVEDEHDILSTALDSGGFSDKSLVDQLMTFLSAGHETTATSLTWAIYHLSLHPELTIRLRNEVRNAIPSSDDTPTSSTLDSLPLLNAFCNEVFRFYVPVPMTFRMNPEPATIGGHLIPAKTLVLVSPTAINHSPQLWGSDAHVFNIDRWLVPGQANAGGASSNFANMTFLHGPRSCIGKDFAKGEFLCLVAATVAKFEFRNLQPEVKVNHRGITSKPVGGMTVALRVVDDW